MDLSTNYTELKWAVQQQRLPVSKLAEQFFPLFCKNFSGIQRTIATITQQPRTFKTHVNWYWGKTGTGKTTTAYEETKDEPTYWKNETLWWDLYEGQPNVIIDDFDGSWPITTLLRLFDRFPYAVNCKGYTMPFTSKKIIVTSNYSPSYLYNLSPLEHLNALLRRIEYTKEFT